MFELILWHLSRHFEAAPSERLFLCVTSTRQRSRLANPLNSQIFFSNFARPRLFIFFHVDVLRATAESLAEVTAARRWRLAASFRISTGLQTDWKWAGETLRNFSRAAALRTLWRGVALKCRSSIGLPAAVLGYFFRPTVKVVTLSS